MWTTWKPYQELSLQVQPFVPQWCMYARLSRAILKWGSLWWHAFQASEVKSCGALGLPPRVGRGAQREQMKSRRSSISQIRQKHSPHKRQVGGNISHCEPAECGLPENLTRNWACRCSHLSHSGVCTLALAELSWNEAASDDMLFKHQRLKAVAR